MNGDRHFDAVEWVLDPFCPVTTGKLNVDSLLLLIALTIYKFNLQILSIPATNVCSEATLEGRGFSLIAQEWVCREGATLTLHPPPEQCHYSKCCLYLSSLTKAVILLVFIT